MPARTPDSDRELIAHCTSGIRRQPTAPDYCTRGCAYLRQQNYAQAIADLTEAIRLEPGNLRAYMARGEAAFRNGEFGQAIADCGHALWLNSRDEQACYWRARALDALCQYDLAVEDYTRALRLQPGFVEAHYHRGRLFYGRNEFDRAIEDFSQVLDLDPRNLYALYFRGMAYTSKFEPEKAIEDYYQAIRLDPIFACVVQPLLSGAYRTAPGPVDNSRETLVVALDATRGDDKAPAQRPVPSLIDSHRIEQDGTIADRIVVRSK